jgi:hypothetical protein
MKKLFAIIALVSFTTTMFYATSPPQVDSIISKASTHINQAGPVIYKDTKELIKYSGNVLEKTAVRLDTLLTHGYKSLSKGAAHTFEVVKDQQVVKSIHHLVYWILSIIILYKFVTALRSVKDSDNASSIILCFVYGILGTFIIIYSSIHFMEMITGFFNPEYGAYLDILDFMNIKQ